MCEVFPVKNLFRNKNTYITLSFYVALLFSPLYTSSAPEIKSILSVWTYFALPNYIILLCPVILTISLRRKTTENDTFILLAFTYSVLFILLFFEFVKSGATLFFVSVALLILSAICINVGQPFASLVLLPGLFLRQLGTGYIAITYIPVLLLLLMNYFRAEKEEKKSLLLTAGAYLYAVIFAVLLFIKGKLTVTFSPVAFSFGAIETAKLVAGSILVLAACVLFIIRTIPLMKNASALYRISTVVFAVYPVAGCIFSCLTGIVSTRPETVFLVTLLIYITGNINISLQTKEALPVLPEKSGSMILLLCCIAMCMLVF